LAIGHFDYLYFTPVRSDGAAFQIHFTVYTHGLTIVYPIHIHHWLGIVDAKVLIRDGNDGFGCHHGTHCPRYLGCRHPTVDEDQTDQEPWI
jgi:hypothetical protein